MFSIIVKLIQPTLEYISLNGESTQLIHTQDIMGTNNSRAEEKKRGGGKSPARQICVSFDLGQ